MVMPKKRAISGIGQGFQIFRQIFFPVAGRDTAEGKEFPDSPANSRALLRGEEAWGEVGIEQPGELFGVIASQAEADGGADVAEHRAGESGAHLKGRVPQPVPLIDQGLQHQGGAVLMARRRFAQVAPEGLAAQIAFTLPDLLFQRPFLGLQEFRWHKLYLPEKGCRPSQQDTQQARQGFRARQPAMRQIDLATGLGRVPRKIGVS